MKTNLNLYEQAPLIPPKLGTGEAKHAVMFVVPDDISARKDFDYIKQAIKDRIEDAVRELAGEVALMAVNNGLIIASRYVIKSRPDYSGAFGNSVEYYVEAHNFVVGMHNAWNPMDNWNRESMIGMVERGYIHPEEARAMIVPSVRHNKEKNVDEWRCGYCGTPQEFTEKNCTQCGGARPLLLHEYQNSR